MTTHKLRVYVDYEINADNKEEAKRMAINLLFSGILLGHIERDAFNTTFLPKRKKHE